MTHSRRLGLLVLSAGVAATAHGDPWLAPGDEMLRGDVQRLADAGILHGPVSTWPMSWPDIARDALAANDRGLDAATADALLRVQRQSRKAATRGSADAGIRASGAYQPTPLRQFANSPREVGEVTLHASFMGNHVAANLQGTYAADPGDGRNFRPDGSYLGLNVGNFMLSAGFMERWWGPGWDGSLILSTNARPIPSVTLERNYSDPFKSRFLSWIGPWRASIAIGEAEKADVPVPDVRFLAARVNFKPRPWLELGLTRTAQWCGGDRSCDWNTFTNLLIGRDNSTTAGERNDEPGNQMAGYDLRLRSPWRKLPVVFFTQWIGEDEAGGLPSKFIGQLGLETWGSSAWGGWRAHLEYADTTCTFTRQDPDFNCAYRNSLYPQGYAYRGRIIGHAMDNDSRMSSLGVSMTRPDGDLVSLTLRHVELNRDGGDHHLSGVPLDLDNVELRYSRDVAAGRLSAGVGFYDTTRLVGASSQVHGFVNWQQGF